MHPLGVAAILHPEQLQFIIDSIPLLVSYVDAEHRYRFNNRAYEQWFGLSPGQLRGTHVRDVLGDAAYEKVRGRIERALAGEGFEFEDLLPYRNGGPRHVRAVYIPDRDDNGRVRGYVAVIDDISQRKASEERLRESAQLESTLNRVGRVLSGEHDVHVIVQAVTDAATQLVGAEFGAFFYNVLNEKGESYTLYTLSGVPHEAFSKFPMPRNTKIFDPTFRGLGIVRSDDITKDPRYGQNAPFHGMPPGHLPVRSYLAVPVVSRSGETLGGLFFGHPDAGRFSQREEDLVNALAVQASIAVDNARLIEQLRSRTDQAEEASRLKDEFLSTASHELRTPLNAILGWTRMLRSGTLSPDSGGRALEVIERNARQQAHLVDDLLEVSRIVSGKLRLEVQPLQLARVVEAALDAVRPAAAAKDIRVVSAVDPDLGLVTGDPDRLQQVIWNILSNAVKFTPPGGRVDISVRREAETVAIDVSDTGIGISPEFIPYVFDRFRQADTGHGRQYGGLGLGLAISRQLVEMHGGTIAAASAGPGQGTTFRVRLPTVAAPSPAAAMQTSEAPGVQPPPSIDSGALTGTHVLIVDDEPDAVELLGAVLQASGAEVTLAGSADDAVRAVDRRVPDVLLSDIGMPGRSGYELMRALRARPAERGGAVPAIALTAYARAEDRTQALRAGFSLHVPKPVDPAELVAAIQSLTRRRLR